MQSTNKCFLTTAENWPRFMSHETLCLVKKILWYQNRWIVNKIELFISLLVTTSI